MSREKVSSELRGFRSAAARELAREPRGDGRERRDPKDAVLVALTALRLLTFAGTIC